jgi:hypothetical protein
MATAEDLNIIALSQGAKKCYSKFAVESITDTGMTDWQNIFLNDPKNDYPLSEFSNSRKYLMPTSVGNSLKYDQKYACKDIFQGSDKYSSKGLKQFFKLPNNPEGMGYEVERTSTNANTYRYSG